MTDELFTRLQPLLAAADLELVDVELRSGVLLVTVDRDGGVDLEALTDANRAVSALLDELDPIPGRYTLEVSSPGVERTLRRPAHFVKAVGETVTVKTRPQVPGDRRLRGVLVAADDDGLTVEVDRGRRGWHPAVLLGHRQGAHRLRVGTGAGCWGRKATPSKSGTTTGAGTKQQATEKKRKQVVTP